MSGPIHASIGRNRTGNVYCVQRSVQDYMFHSKKIGSMAGTTQTLVCWQPDEDCTSTLLCQVVAIMICPCIACLATQGKTSSLLCLDHFVSRRINIVQWLTRFPNLYGMRQSVLVLLPRVASGVLCYGLTVFFCYYSKLVRTNLFHHGL